MFCNKVEITIHILKSLNIKPSAYGSLLIPVFTGKSPTNLQTLLARKVSDRVWELNELLTLFKNELEAKERSLGSGYNFKEKQDKIGKCSALICFREAVVLNSVVYFVKVIIIHQIDVLK